MSKLPKYSKEENILSKIHSCLIEFGATYRDMVCEDMDWTIQTYYRKCRFDENAHGKRVMPILNQVERNCLIKHTHVIHKKIGMLITQITKETDPNQQNQ